MTQYFFYTDPLAAAWMAKHFGMRFIDEGKDNEAYGEDLDSFFFEGQTGATIACIGPFVVHPDSLHLLKPQLGDIVSMTKAMDRYAAVKDEQFIEAFEETGDYKIIQRNGIAFHWPESEPFSDPAPAPAK
jgi:hypothetical protein